METEKSRQGQRVRMTREMGQSVILSTRCGCCDEAVSHVEVRVSQVSAGGTAILLIATDSDGKVQVVKGEDFRRGHAA